MSHWAELDEKNIVLRVTIGDDNDSAGDEGYQWLLDNLGGTWIKTSLDKNFRKNFAGIGFTYDEKQDAFIPPQPFASWILNEENCQWEPPLLYPSDGKNYSWDESTQSWVEPTPSA